MYGIERIVSTKDGSNWTQCPALWQEIVANGMYQKLIESTHLPVPEEGLNLTNAINCYRDTVKDTIPYMVFAFKTKESDTTNYTVINVPAATWAVFRSDYTQSKEDKYYSDIWIRVEAGIITQEGFHRKKEELLK